MQTLTPDEMTGLIYKLSELLAKRKIKTARDLLLPLLNPDLSEVLGQLESEEHFIATLLLDRAPDMFTFLPPEQ